MQSKSNRNWFVLMVLATSIAIMGKTSFAANELRSEGPTVRSQVAKILLSSLGGAVLGISTLSFYDRPQDHLSNVAVGGTVGALLGSIYVTKESLDYENTASFYDGGSWNFLALPQNNLYGCSWRFSF